MFCEKCKSNRSYGPVVTEAQFQTDTDNTNEITLNYMLRYMCESCGKVEDVNMEYIINSKELAKLITCNSSVRASDAIRLPEDDINNEDKN